MTGKRFLNSVLAVAMLCVLWGVPADADADGQGPVAVLLSDDEQAYRLPVAAFMHEMEAPVEVFDLKGDIERAPEVMTTLLGRQPVLIFALGAKASYAAKVWTKDHAGIPVIFAMVINWGRYNLLEGQQNVAGISSEVAPGTQFVYMTLFAPELRNIGVIYSEEQSGEITAQARAAAERLHLELVAMPVERPEDFKRAYRKMADKVDAFWILPDPVIYTLENLAWLEKRCIQDRLVCIGQSRNITRLGVLLSLDPDNGSVGSQAAALAREILRQGKAPASIGVMPPLGTQLLFNKRTAEKLGIAITPPVLDMASEIVEK